MRLGTPRDYLLSDLFHCFKRWIQQKFYFPMKFKLTSLVTGAADFIGSRMMDDILARSHTVIALDKLSLSGGFASNVNPKAQFVRGSILDQALIAWLPAAIFSGGQARPHGRVGEENRGAPKQEIRHVRYSKKSATEMARMEFPV